MSQFPQPSVHETWPWPDSLDALRAAPAHHEFLFENERVRVIHTHIPSGDMVPLHTHRWPSVAYVMVCSDFVRRDHDGKVLFDSRQEATQQSAPSVQWLPSLPPHTVENVGASPISILIVELKDSKTG
jgi:quercetin dioxygenase-like cupin family protein